MIAHLAPAPPSAVCAPSAADPNISPELREKCDELGDLYARRDRNSVVNRYDIGALVLGVRLDAKGCYGSGAVATLGHERGRSERTLYEHSRVAEQWSREEIVRNMAKRMRTGERRGQSLLWSHFRALDRDELTDPDRRLWIAKALRQGLSPAEMTAAINEALGIENPAYCRILRRTGEIASEFAGQEKKLRAASQFLPKFDLALLVDTRCALEAVEKIARAAAAQAKTLRDLVARHQQQCVSAIDTPPLEFCEHSQNPRAGGAS
jgi:hypothetical protein